MRGLVLGAALAAVVVAGCSPADPGKDVAAVVAGETITVAELEREIASSGARKPEDPAVRQSVLDAMISRKLLAKAARAAKLDRTPEALAAKKIADESFDAGLDRVNTIASVPAPTPAEVKAYVAAHPEMFANRTGYLIEQLQVPQRHTPEILAALAPTKTLEAAEAVLKARQLPYRRVVVPMDTLRADPRVSDAVANLPAGEPFILPDPAGFTVNRVRGSRVSPVTGQEAEAIAAERIRTERVNKALRDRMKALYKSQVVYGPAFAPKPPPSK